MEKNTDEVLREIEKRKVEHIKFCKEKNVERGTTLFECVHLIHKAFPQFDFDEVNTSTAFFEKMINAPIIIEAITGGSKVSEKINKRLASVAEEFGIVFGLGSQRAGLEYKELKRTYYVRDVAPSIPVLGNIGAVQLLEYEVEEIEECIEMAEIDALCVHFNALQEIVQHGDVKWSGVKEKLEVLCKELKCPIIAKEVGCGIDVESGMLLEKIGVDMIDVAGVGGTSFAFVEYLRTKDELGLSFASWGLPTAFSLITLSKNVKIPLISSGGIRNGIDGAKSIALGASYFGAALPFLRAVMESEEKAKDLLSRWIKELKSAMFLTGCKDIEDLKKSKVIITGTLREMLDEFEKAEP